MPLDEGMNRMKIAGEAPLPARGTLTLDYVGGGTAGGEDAGCGEAGGGALIDVPLRFRSNTKVATIAITTTTTPIRMELVGLVKLGGGLEELATLMMDIVP